MENFSSKQPPKFLKEFSKENSFKDRKIVADEVKIKRGEYFFKKGKKESLKTEADLEIKLGNEHLQGLLKELKELEENFEELSDSGVKKFLNYFRIKKLKSELDQMKEKYQLMDSDIGKHKLDMETEIAQLELETGSAKLKETKSVINNFYENQKIKWEQSGYSKADIEKYFSEENLVSLSLEDYILLLKRFPSEMVTHVTRQGIRDHVGHMYHTGGQGEYSNGFIKVMENGHLKPKLSLILSDVNKEEFLKAILKMHTKDITLYDSSDEIFEDFEKTFITLDDVAKLSDFSAIHFATEEVADSYYGSERENEIFFAFPSAFIASQTSFRGDLKEGGGGYHNDQWIWAQEEKGLNVNAGLVFIPEDALVDRNTGSRYRIDEKGNPVQNQEFQSLLKNFVDSPNFLDFVDKVLVIVSEINPYSNDTEILRKNNELQEQLRPFRVRMEQEFNIIDPKLQSAIFEDQGYGLDKLKMVKQMEKEYGRDQYTNTDKDIDTILENASIYYILAQNPINSREYWETYFQQHPNYKPSKIVFYKGGDPTKALNEFRLQNSLRKKTESINLGFPERHGLSKEKHSMIVNSPLTTRFMNLIRETINKEYVLVEEERKKVVISDDDII